MPARWNRGDLGIVSPADFIPIAEETGLIIPIYQWVLREACKQQKQWLSEGYPLKTVSVNLFVQQFYQGNLVSKVTQILRETELDPHYLILENYGKNRCRHS
ncbi:EAL domain-containing protein [Salipaludibacillus sp. CF4.18]|uniref:EAL domain-containing protein n=1 Tax=Salipaludibacillus sp. CF4.18 TaxID=3373081 RepID=UPI003EE71A97